MPQALAIAFPVVFGATGSVALVTAAGTLTLAGSLVSIGGSLLLSVAVNSRNRPAGVDPANVQLTLRQAIGDRIKQRAFGGDRIAQRDVGIGQRMLAPGFAETSQQNVFVGFQE